MSNVLFIDDTIYFPTLLAVSGLTLLSAFTLFLMFPRLLSVSREKRLRVARVLRKVTVCFISLVCLALGISLFCYLWLNLIPLSSCMMLFVSAHLGVDDSQIRRCCSFRPLPLVKPPPVCRPFIRTCSMTSSIHNPVQTRSLPIAT